jgi:hypothetical protein
MTTYRRVASTVNGGIVIETGDKTLAIDESDLATYDTAAKLLAEAERQADSTLADLYFHVNRDGSVVIATGCEPEVWPEDVTGDG